MGLIRRHDWHDRLHDFIEARRDDKYVIGTTDCLTFMAGAIEAMTDTNLLDGWPRYTTKAQYMRLLSRGATIKGVKHKGPKYTPNLLNAMLGDQKPVTFAQVGDLVAVEGPMVGRHLNGGTDTYTVEDGLDAPCIVAFDGMTAVSMGHQGVGLFNIRDAKLAWSV